MVSGAYSSPVRHTYTFVDYRVQIGDLYNYKIESISSDGQNSMSSILSVHYQISAAPTFKSGLFQNHPNPFNPETVISYELEEQCDVTLKIFTLLGDLVDTVVDEKQNAGFYSYIFRPSKEPTGAYFYILKSNDYAARKQMLYIK